MSVQSFHTLDVASVRKAILDLYEQVANGKGRVEITREGSPETCVMISKTELESLEKALEILADSDEMRTVSESLARVAPSTVCPPTNSRISF